ncbi:MAG: hypothetical protein ABI868_05095 [Acidobacteriota bacterium]
MKRLLHTGWALLALLTGACHDPSAYVISPDNADQILRVDVSAASIPADGLSRTTIKAAIAPGAAADRRDVTFTTNTGTLVFGARTGLTVTVTADVAGEAVLQLQSSPRVESALVEVKVLTIARTVTVEFTPPVPDSTFTLAASPETIRADGFSQATVSAQLQRLGTTEQRIVEFKTTAGTLTAPGVTAGSVIRVGANADGQAAASLQASKLAETAHVTATALNVTRSVDVTFTAANPSDIIRLASTDSSLPADGKSTARMTATIAPGLPADKRTVTFRMTGTGGVFLPEGQQQVTRDADASGQARVDVQADSKTGFARVVAEVDKTTSNDVLVPLVPALPDQIFFRSDVVRLSSGNAEATVTAELRRNIGKVNEGTIVSFSAVTNTGTVIGAFRDVRTSDATGSATARFSLGTTPYLGPIVLTASVAGGPSASITLIVQ